MIRKLVLAAFVLSTAAVVGPAGAQACSAATPVPPTAYQGGTHAPPVVGYRAATGLPAKAWVGAYYQDGYAIADVSDPSKPTFRAYVQYNYDGHHGSNARIVGGTSPDVCVHAWPFSQWPLSPSADGCVLTSTGKSGACSFKGRGRIGTEAFNPIPGTSVPADVPGAYVAAAQTWAIYTSTATTSSIVLGSSVNSAPGGLITLTNGTTYYACLGTVNTTKTGFAACTPSGNGAIAVLRP